MQVLYPSSASLPSVLTGAPPSPRPLSRNSPPSLTFPYVISKSCPSPSSSAPSPGYVIPAGGSTAPGHALSGDTEGPWRRPREVPPSLSQFRILAGVRALLPGNPVPAYQDVLGFGASFGQPQGRSLASPGGSALARPRRHNLVCFSASRTALGGCQPYFLCHGRA